MLLRLLLKTSGPRVSVRVRRMACQLNWRCPRPVIVIEPAFLLGESTAWCKDLRTQEHA